MLQEAAKGKSWEEMVKRMELLIQRQLAGE